MAYLIDYSRAPGRLAAAMSLGTARETLELVRCLAASESTVSTIRCTSRGGHSITIEQLEACARPERRPAAANRPEARMLPEQPLAAVERLAARLLPERPPGVVSDTIKSPIKRHSIAGSYA